MAILLNVEKGILNLLKLRTKTLDNIQIKSPYNGQIWGLLHSGHIVAHHEPLASIFTGSFNDGYKYFDFQHKAVAGTILREVLQFIQL